MRLDNNQKAFLELLRAGLWEKEARLSQYQGLDYAAILQLAEEQSVVGLVTAGLEHVSDVKVPQEWVLQFIGETLQIEQQNKAMNEFVARLFEQLRNHDIYALLVKGQGIAQCYERPFWRSSGDIDLLISEANYIKGKDYLISTAYKVDEEDIRRKHQSMILEEWTVELHGTLRSGLWKRLDALIDNVQYQVFNTAKVRIWNNGSTQVNLSAIDEDIIFVFAHILQHFFKEGVGIRQICDWCRLLWTYRDSIDINLLESRLRSAGIVSEWKSLSSLAVNRLGMPEEEMVLYSKKDSWDRKADRILKFVLFAGNMGHNRDMSYRNEQNVLKRSILTLYNITKDGLQYFTIFPLDSIRVWYKRLANSLQLKIQDS